MPIPDSHTPRGYHEIKIPVSESSVEEVQRIRVLSCDKCGALTMMHHTHDKWHKKMDLPK